MGASWAYNPLRLPPRISRAVSGQAPPLPRAGPRLRRPACTDSTQRGSRHDDASSSTQASTELKVANSAEIPATLTLSRPSRARTGG